MRSAAQVPDLGSIFRFKWPDDDVYHVDLVVA
jgi:hypothetical protein